MSARQGGLRRSGSSASGSSVYARAQAGTADLHRSPSGTWRSAAVSKKQDKFISSFMKEKQHLRTQAPPIFGIFSPTTVGSIPFEVERRVERARLELEEELAAERGRALEELREKLRVGAELHLQEQRAATIRRSQELAKNPAIFRRAQYYIMKEAYEVFGIEPPGQDMFERFDVGEDLLSEEKRAELRAMARTFLEKYRSDLEETARRDVAEEREHRLSAATEQAVRVAAHWEAVTREDADDMNETLLQDAKLRMDVAGGDSFETTLNHCSTYSGFRAGRPVPNTFDAAVSAGSGECPQFKQRLFTPDSFFDKAMKDKDVLLARVRQYVSAVVTARVSEAAVDYDEHSLLREARRLEQQYGGRSLGNTSLDKFKDMYTERAVDGTDEYCGSDSRAVSHALQRLRLLALRVELTQHRHAFALEKIRDDMMTSAGHIVFDR